MKTLNLIDESQSEIVYTISKFPDGQQQVKIAPYSWSYPPTIEHRSVTIKSRLNNFMDLELIMCAIASLKGLGVEQIHLYSPYILGARSDRKFEEGSNNYLKTVVCPLINAMQISSITILDPHSDCLEMGLNNFIKKDNCEFVKWALTQINNKDQDVIFISPDGGALKKIYKVADYVSFKGDIVTCSKSRGANGELSKVVVPMGDLWNSNKDAVIIDDICDGGATFINIAKELKANGWKNKIYLVVTHGIFSKGFGELQQSFDGVYCTNSYQTLTACEPFVKQLNIF